MNGATFAIVCAVTLPHIPPFLPPHPTAPTNTPTITIRISHLNNTAFFLPSRPHVFHYSTTVCNHAISSLLFSILPITHCHPCHHATPPLIPLCHHTTPPLTPAITPGHQTTSRHAILLIILATSTTPHYLTLPHTATVLYTTSPNQASLVLIPSQSVCIVFPLNLLSYREKDRTELNTRPLCDLTDRGNCVVTCASRPPPYHTLPATKTTPPPPPTPTPAVSMVEG